MMRQLFLQTYWYGNVPTYKFKYALNEYSWIKQRIVKILILNERGKFFENESIISTSYHKHGSKAKQLFFTKEKKRRYEQLYS